MDVEGELNGYVVQAVGEDEENTEMIVENSTIVICSENGEQTHYVPFSVEGGQIILKRIDSEDLQITRLENCEETDDEVSVIEDNCIEKEEESNINEIMKPTSPKRKLSYETEFKPCMLPPNRGGMKGIIRYGRKHLIIDQQIMINPREFKAQLNSTNDLIMKPDLAPCTKQQMRHMLTGITRLFAYPAHKMPNNKLLQLYVSNCTSREQENSEIFTDMELLPIGYQVEVDPSKIKRITRKRRYPEAEEYIRNHLNNESESVQKSSNVDIQQLLEAANTASNDHGYTKRSTDSSIQNDHLPKSEPELQVEPQIYIMQGVDENGTQSSIEVLLAAAAETSDEDEVNSEQFQQILTVCETPDLESGQKHFYIVQRDDVEEILGERSEYILS